MAAKHTQHETPTLESTLDQVKELNEQFAKSAREAGKLYVESCEWAVDRVIDLEQRLAGLSRQEWLKDVIEAQTEAARELSASYATAARSLLK